MPYPKLRFALTLALFFGSGAAALIYEVVWFHALSLVIGASGLSLAILLASFMGGMCLGSLAYPSVAPSGWKPLRVYAGLELAIAFCGLASMAALPWAGPVYGWIAAHLGGGVWVRSVLSGLVLLPPTVCMGATLPAVARGVATTRAGLARLGWAYGANTFGAVFGTLLAGFYLLRMHDIYWTAAVAVVLNLCVGALAWSLSRAEPGEAEIEPDMKPERAVPDFSAPVVLAVTAISGFTALGAEVVWTRLLSLLFGPTTYTFSIILAVFLSGLGLGSAVGAAFARRARQPGLALGVCQLLLLGALPWAAWMIVGVVPYWFTPYQSPMLDGRGDVAIGTRMGWDLLRAAAALLPATCLWGASFPLAVATLSGRVTDSGRLVARVYAFNTLGAIGGSLGACLLGIPQLGSQAVQAGLILLAAVSALLMAGGTLASIIGRTSGQPWLEPRGMTVATLMLLAAAIGGPVMFKVVPPTPVGLLAHGRRVDLWNVPLEYIYASEGLDAAVAVSISPLRDRCFHVSGKTVASNSLIDLRTEHLLGHLPALMFGKPRRVLVVGCGAGVTAGAFPLHSSVERIVICDIEAQVPYAARTQFSAENNAVLQDPRTEVVIDDARHFLASTSEKFDVITTDPIHPWVRGAAALYTVEFFKLCQAHLNPGGVVCQWVPLYESNAEAVQCELATFLHCFPNGSVWSSDPARRGYDLVLVGGEGLPLLDREHMREVLAQCPTLRRVLQGSGLGSPDDVLKTFVTNGTDLTDWLQGVALNRDRNLRLQYLAGLSPDRYEQEAIFAQIVERRWQNDTTWGRRLPLGN